jgi:hypothetical protein
MDVKKRAMLEALEKSLGVVTTAAKQMDMSRDTHYKWMDSDEEYKEAVKALDEVAIDFAESNLHRRIKDGDTTATIFYLKTKGKRRGYVERQELTGQEGQPIIVIAGNL